MDIWTKEKSSEVMSKIRSKNTKSEMMLRKYLYSKGLRYRINYKKLPVKPDIVLSKYKLAIFVNGCFWHGHDNCKIAHIPKTNMDFWKNKIKKNKTRDEVNILKIISLGWNVYTVWECEIKNQNLEGIYKKINNMLINKHKKHTSLKVEIYEQKDEKVMKVSEKVYAYKTSEK